MVGTESEMTEEDKSLAKAADKDAVQAEYAHDIRRAIEDAIFTRIHDLALALTDDRRDALREYIEGEAKHLARYLFERFSGEAWALAGKPAMDELQAKQQRFAALQVLADQEAVTLRAPFVPGPDKSQP